MKLTADFNTEEKLKGSVDQICLLQIMNSLCTFAFRKNNILAKTEFVIDALCVMTGLYDLDKKRNRQIIIKYQNDAYQNGLKLGDEGHDLLILAAAIKTSMTILDSGSEDWKAALKTKLNETKTTLKIMRRKLENKSKHKKLKVAKTTIIHFCSQQHRQDSQVQEEKESAFKATSEKGF